MELLQDKLQLNGNFNVRFVRYIAVFSFKFKLQGQDKNFSSQKMEKVANIQVTKH